MVAREITKVYEEFLRGTISEILEKIGEAEVKGEVTVVLAGHTREAIVDSRSVREALKVYMKMPGFSMKEAVKKVAEDLRVAKREVYQEALRMKNA